MHPATTARARQVLTGLALMVAVVVLLGACAAPAARPAVPSSAPHDAIGAEAATSPAAELRAGLTGRLVERTYLVAALGRRLTAAGGDRDAPPVVASVEALDQASTALADVLGATYSTAHEPLLDALRQVDGLLAEPDPSGAVRERLAAAYEQLGAVVRRVVPVLDAEEVGARLATEVQALTAQPEQLRAVAAEAARTARLLAAGIAADRRLGDVDTPAIQLRSGLTGLLTEHVLLVGALTEQPAAPDALAGNALALGELLGDSYPTLRAPFVRSWQAHVERLERYAQARAGGGTGAAELGLVRGFPGELARQLASHVEGLPPRTAEAELGAALELLVRAVPEGTTPARPGLLREAAAGALPVAALLAAAVAEDLRLT